MGQYQLIAVLPTGDFAAVDSLDEVELRRVPQDVWEDWTIGTGGEHTVLDRSVTVPRAASLWVSVPDGERRYQVLVEVTEAEFETLAMADRRPTLLQWNDQSQAILGTDLARIFVAAIQTVEERYEDLHPADGDSVEMDVMTVPMMQELLSAVCMFYDNHPEVGIWWNESANGTKKLLEKYPVIREVADKALAAFRAEEARGELPEFPTYVDAQGNEHAEF